MEKGGMEGKEEWKGEKPSFSEKLGFLLVFRTKMRWDFFIE